MHSVLIARTAEKLGVFAAIARTVCSTFTAAKPLASMLYSRARILEAAAPQNHPKFARPQRPTIVFITRTTHKQSKMGLRLKCGFCTLELVKCKLHKDHRGVDLVSGVLPFGRLW